MNVHLEKAFLSLPREGRDAIISCGASFRLAALQNRLFLAESKVRHFEEEYQTTLARLDTEGLPNDAGYEMHEDYIMWHHWDEVARKTRKLPFVIKEVS